MAFIGLAAFLASIGYFIVMFNAPGGDLESAGPAWFVALFVMSSLWWALSWLSKRLPR